MLCSEEFAGCSVRVHSRPTDLRYEEIVHLCNECPSPRHGRRPESKPKPSPRAASATVLNVDLLDALLPPTGEPRHSEYGTDAFWRRVDTYAARLHETSRPSVGRAEGATAIQQQRALLAGQRGDGGASPANGLAVGGAQRSTARFALLGRAIAELDALADGVRCAELKVRCAAPPPCRVYRTRRFVAGLRVIHRYR